MVKRLTKVQLCALSKFKNSRGLPPSSLGVRRDVAWRLVQRGYLTSVGAWSLTRAGEDEISAHSKEPSK